MPTISHNSGLLLPSITQDLFGKSMRNECDDYFILEGAELLNRQDKLNKFSIMMELLERNGMSAERSSRPIPMQCYVDIEGISENLNGQLAKSSDAMQRTLKEADYEVMLYNTLSTQPGYALGQALANNVPSSQPHITSLQDLIRAIHKEYQSNYAEINKAAAEFMKDINTLVGKFSAAVSSGDDGKLNVDEKKFIDEMSAVMNKYTSIVLVHNGKLNIDFPGELKWQKPIYEFKADDTELKFWQDKLQPGFTVEKTKDGKIGVYADLKPLFEMATSVVKNGVNGEINSWQHHPSVLQSIQSAVDSQKNAVNNAVSQLVEKFRQDNGSFDNLIQMLSKLVDDLFHYNQSYLS